ncbi:MAG: DUF2304 domain-containing protein [Lachnospiraceae bacterium]|nr:DUF2304 domain-containing protein [Lachnospiraceae bacterium]
MTVKLQLIVGAVLILGMLLILIMVKKRSLDLKYALSWLLGIVLVLILDCFPKLLNRLSRALGVFSPVNMIFFLGFCFSLLIIFTLTVIVSRMSERIRKLSQAVALNEEKLRILTADEQKEKKEDGK